MDEYPISESTLQKNRLTTSQMGALTRKAGAPCLLPPWAQRVLCIGLGHDGRGVVGRGFAGGAEVVLVSHVCAVLVAAVLGRGRGIVGVWGGHNIWPLGHRLRTAHGHGCSCVSWTVRLVSSHVYSAHCRRGSRDSGLLLLRCAALHVSCTARRGVFLWAQLGVSRERSRVGCGLPWHRWEANGTRGTGLAASGCCPRPVAAATLVNPARRNGTMLPWHAPGVHAIAE